MSYWKASTNIDYSMKFGLTDSGSATEPVSLVNAVTCLKPATSPLCMKRYRPNSNGWQLFWEMSIPGPAARTCAKITCNHRKPYKRVLEEQRDPRVKVVSSRGSRQAGHGIVATDSNNYLSCCVCGSLRSTGDRILRASRCRFRLCHAGPTSVNTHGVRSSPSCEREFKIVNSKSLQTTHWLKQSSR